MQYYVKKSKRRSKSVAIILLEIWRVVTRIECEKIQEKILDRRIIHGRIFGV
jgi:hypothetical protein